MPQNASKDVIPPKACALQVTGCGETSELSRSLAGCSCPHSLLGSPVPARLQCPTCTDSLRPPPHPHSTGRETEAQGGGGACPTSPSWNGLCGFAPGPTSHRGCLARVAGCTVCYFKLLYLPSLDLRTRTLGVGGSSLITSLGFQVPPGAQVWQQTRVLSEGRGGRPTHSPALFLHACREPAPAGSQGLLGIPRVVWNPSTGLPGKRRTPSEI